MYPTDLSDARCGSPPGKYIKKTLQYDKRKRNIACDKPAMPFYILLKLDEAGPERWQMFPLDSPKRQFVYWMASPVLL